MAFTDDFFSNIGSAVVKATSNTPLFPSVAMAQAALESNWGRSLLSSKYNNYFGIKAIGGWNGDVVNMNTREVYNGTGTTVNAGFRVYPSVEASFKDRTKFLLDNPRYTKAGVFTAKTPVDQAKALQKAGYATDPLYAQQIEALIKKYNLTRFDKKKELEKLV